MNIIYLTIAATAMMPDMGMGMSLIYRAAVFVLVSFIPGYILQHYFFRNKNHVAKILHSVGLSLLFVTGIALVMNTLPAMWLGDQPLRRDTLLVALLGSTVALNARYPITESVSVPNLSGREIRWMAVLSMLPIYAVLGAYLQNTYNIDLVLYTGIIGVAVLILCSHWIPGRLYPLAIYCSALTLVFSFALVAGYLRFGDATLEWAFAHLTIEQGKWIVDIPRTKNPMLILVLTQPSIALVSDIKLEVLYRFYYPIWFSLSAVAVYQSLRQACSARTSYISSTIYISVYPFSEWLSQSTRQGFAVFFFCLLLMTLENPTEDKKSLERSNILVSLYGFGIIISHYATGILITFGFLCVFFWRFIARNRNDDVHTPKMKFLTLAIYGTVITGWYMYTADSYILEKSGSLIAFMLIKVKTVITSGFQFGGSSDGGGFLSVALSASGGITFTLVIITLASTVLLIGVGGLTWGIKHILGKEHMHLSNERVGLSLSFVIMMGATVVIPELSRTITPDRIFIIGLVCFVPFIVLASRNLSSIAGYLTLVERHRSTREHQFPKILITFIFILFILNSGIFSAVVTNEYSPGIELQQDEILQNGNDYEKINLLKRTVVPTDVASTKWYLDHMNPKIPLYSAEGRGVGGILATPYGLPIDAWNVYRIPESLSDPRPDITRLDKESISNPKSENGYIYSGYMMEEENIVVTSISRPTTWVNKSELDPYLKNKNNIYDNGKSSVLEFGS